MPDFGIASSEPLDDEELDFGIASSEPLDDAPPPKDIRPLAKQRLDRLTSGDPALGDAPAPAPQGPPSLRQVAAGRRDRLVASQLPQPEAPDTPLYHPLRAVGRSLAEQNPTNPVTVGDMISAPFKIVPAMRESKNPYFSGIGEWAQEPVAKVSKLTDIYADNPALSFVSGAPPPEAVRMAGRVAESFTSPEMLASFGVPGTGFGGLAAKVPVFGTAALLHGAAELPEQTQQLLAQTIAGDKEGLRETLPEWGTNAAFTALAGRHMLGRQEAHDAQRENRKDAVAYETAQQARVAIEQPAVNKAPTHEEAARAEEWRAAEWEAAQRTEAERVAAERESRAQQWRAAEWEAAQREQAAEVPQNAPGGAEQGGMQPASLPTPSDVKLGLARRLAAQRAAQEGVDAGGPPVQPPPGASGPAEPPPAGPAPAEVAAEPVGRPAVAPAEAPSGRGTLKEPWGDTNYLRPLGDLTDKLYHETSVGSALEAIPGVSISAHPGERFLSNDPDIATGQGGNKGVLLEFAPGDIRGIVAKGKPAARLSYDNGSAEFLAKHTEQAQFQDALRAVTVKKTALAQPGERRLMKNNLARLEKEGWTKTVNPDGSTTWRRPAVEPRSERLAPEPKEQLDAQLAAVGDGSKPGVFYPVQNGHEVPDTPPGLARVDGEQGSLIFDPKRVPVEKAQRAVDTGENLHEVIGMSGPREGVTDPEPGMVRLYRMGAPGEHEGRPPTKKADWIEEDPRYQATLKASGRWFTDDRAEAEWYRQEHPEGQLYYVDVPAADVEGYRVGKRSGSKDTPDNPAAYSLRPEKELFLPPDVAARKRPFAEAVAVTTRDARGVPITDEQTADPQRAMAAATPPEGGSVEVRPLADVVEERRAASDREDLARPPGEVGVGQEPVQAEPLARGGEEAPSAGGDAQAQGRPGGVLPARERLVREAKTAGMGTPEQVDAVAQVWDARAKQWAKETGQSVGQFFQKFFGGVKKGGAPKGSLKQGEAPVFYSKLRRVVEGMRSPVTPEQLRGYLKAQGVKAEEMEWTNLDSALEGKRLVRPEELLKHLDANEVRLEEVSKGGPDSLSAKDRETLYNQAIQRHNAALQRAQRQSQITYDIGSKAHARAVSELMAAGLSKNEAWDAVDEWRDAIHPDPDKFKVSGYDAYRATNGEPLGITEASRSEAGGAYRIRPSQEMIDLENAYNEAGAEHKRLIRLSHEARAEKDRVIQHLDNTSGGFTKYEQYQVPGGEGYRELLLRLPETGTKRTVFEARTPVEVRRNAVDGKWYVVDRDGEWGETPHDTRAEAEAVMLRRQTREGRLVSADYRSPHWDEPNVLAHVRFSSRDGGKTLHLEEIQSDWHQQGKKQGYQDAGRFAVSAIQKPEGYWEVHDTEGRFVTNVTDAKTAGEAIAEANRRMANNPQSTALGTLVPDAPFKKTWPELAFKRMLRYAAENGYERVTWTTGDTQAERYDLAKQLDKVAYTLDKSTGKYEITGIKDMRDVFRRQGLGPAELDDVVGKDLGTKIRAGEYTEGNAHLDTEYETSGVFDGVDLKVGGEGMKGFYDKIIPSIADKLGKRFGAKVTEGAIEDGVRVHSMEITPAMRESVMEGQPLFQKSKGAVSFMEDGKAVIHALNQPDVSTFLHESAHVFRRTLTDADRAIAERVYGVKDGEWKRPHEERWATDFENYAMTGKAPTTALARVFEQFKQWLTDIYKSVKGAEVHPEIKALFDRMLGGEEKPTETLAERKRRMDAEIQATGDDLRSLDGLRALIKEVDPSTKMRLLQKAIPGAGPRTKQWAYDELERVRSEERTEAPVNLAPTPERKANVRADELVTKVLGENIGAQRRQAATFAIDELVAGRPATKGVFTLPEENAVRAELGLPARKLAVKKGGVAVAPLPGAKSLGAGAGGNDMTSPLGHGFLGRAIDSAKAVGRGVVQGVAKFRGKETPGASVDIGDPVDANPTPRGVPNTLPDSVAVTGGAKRNISNLAEARNLFGGGQQNTINVESPEAAAALRMAAVHTAAARTVHQETMKKMEGIAKDGLRRQGLKGDELVTAARDRVYDTLRWLSGSNQEGLHQRWIDLKEAAGRLDDKDFLSAARDSEIKTPIEALSQKKWLFEDYADEKLATALAKAVKEKNAKRAREIVDDAYGRAIEAHREQTFSDPNATMDSIEAEPWLGPMLEAWDNGTGKLLEQVHRSNEGIFRQEKYLGRAKRYFPGIEAEAPTKAGGIRRPEHANQTNPDNKFATGISETGYSIAPEDIIHSASRSLFVNGRAAAEQALLDAGVSYDLPPGAEHPKTMLYKGREVEAKVEPTQTLWRMRRDGKLEQAVDLKYRVYPAQIHREMSPIFAPGVHDPHTFLKRVVDNINSAQMAGLTDLSAHVTNQILTLFNNATPIFMYAHKKASSAEQGNYVGNLLKAMWADLDSPEIQARMREMAMNGQLHPATGASTFYTDQADFLGIHDAVKPFGKEWLNVFPVDPKTGKRSLRLLPADLGPLLTGTGRGMDLALDTRIRVLLDQVGEHIFESTNPGKKWADNPQLRFDFTKQLGIYHRGLEGRLIEFMKDVPIFGRLAPFATAGTTFNRNGIAALFGGTFEMPVGEGAKAQVLNRYRAYGVAAGIAAPVATWVLLYKQHTGKYPWEDERSKFMQIPINDETRKSAFGRQLWGDDMTKTAYLNLGKYTPFTRGLRVTGARNFNPLDKAKEGLETKDRALMAFTDVINGWLHPWTGPAVGMASVASSGFEPRFQYSPKAGRPALSPAYRGKWSPGKNLKASVLHGNPMVANYHRAKLEDRTTFGSVVDSVASGLLQNSRTPASKLEKLLAKRTPLVTKEMSDEKLAEYDYIRKTTAALRHGEDKEKVMADLREKVKAGFIGEGKAKDIVEAAAMPDWYDDFEGANVEDAADAWLVATPEQRKRLGGVFGKKVKHWQGLATQKNLSKADRDRIKAKIARAVASATP